MGLTHVYLGELMVRGNFTLNKSEGSNYWMLLVFTKLCLHLKYKHSNDHEIIRLTGSITGLKRDYRILTKHIIHKWYHPRFHTCKDKVDINVIWTHKCGLFWANIITIFTKQTHTHTHSKGDKETQRKEERERKRERELNIQKTERERDR